MKKTFNVIDDEDFDPKDELLPEYDLRSLRVVARGPARQSPPVVIELAPDVAAYFPDARSVNEALRTLIRFLAPAQNSSESVLR
ncbi:MAG: hypothetical protein ACREEM_02495 [Blastocatellia bacterium]